MPRIRTWLFVGAVLAASVSLGAAIRNAVGFSIDSRIGAARALAAGVNPFEGAEGGTFYLHALYVGLLPFSRLNEVDARLAFGLLNVGLGLLLVRTLARGLRLDRRTSVVLGLIMLTSTPFRVTVGNAQTGLIVLALAAPFFVLRGRVGAAVLGGISLVKWSFAPPLLLWVLVRRGFRDLLSFGIAPLAGFLVFGLMVVDLSVGNLLRPFIQEQSILVDLGYADLMTLVRQIVGDGRAAIVAPLLLMAGLSIVVVRTFRDERIAFAALLIVSLVTVYHLSYDLIALMPAVAIALRNRQYPAARAILVIAAYFFYIDLALKVAESIGRYPDVAALGSLPAVIEVLDEMVRSPGPVVVLLHLSALLTVGVLLYTLDRRAATASST